MYLQIIGLFMVKKNISNNKNKLMNKISKNKKKKIFKKKQ